jgi:hypothetical protein
MTTWTVYTCIPGCLPEGDGPPPTFDNYDEAREYWRAEVEDIEEQHRMFAEEGDTDADLLAEYRAAEEAENPTGPLSLELPFGDWLYLSEVEQ